MPRKGVSIFLDEGREKVDKKGVHREKGQFVRKVRGRKGFVWEGDAVTVEGGAVYN